MSPADEFLTTLRAGCQRLKAKSNRWLVAISGGADSTALLRGLVQLQPEFGWELTAAHFDHRLRGVESAADAAWVRELAAKLQVPSCIGAAEEDLPRDEESARRQRYTFLELASRESDCPLIATAHTADDQAETVLHHLFRGTGVAGLKGIPVERSLTAGLTIVRPMLGVTRAQVLGFLESLGQDFRRDSTNADVKLTRNWLRHDILPVLQQRWPQVAVTLCRLAEQAEELSAAMSQLARELLSAALVDDGAEVVRVRVSPLMDRPRHLVRQMFVELWHDRGWPLQDMSYEQWNRLADLVLTDGACTLPGGVEARRRGGLLILQRPHPACSFASGTTT